MTRLTSITRRNAATLIEDGVGLAALIVMLLVALHVPGMI